MIILHAVFKFSKSQFWQIFVYSCLNFGKTLNLSLFSFLLSFFGSENCFSNNAHVFLLLLKFQHNIYWVRFKFYKKWSGEFFRVTNYIFFKRTVSFRNHVFFCRYFFFPKIAPNLTYMLITFLQQKYDTNSTFEQLKFSDVIKTTIFRVKLLQFNRTTIPSFN